MVESTKCGQCKRAVTAIELRSAQQLLVQLAPAGLTQRLAVEWVADSFKAICLQCAEDAVRDASL